MQHRLVELPELGKGERCKCLRLAVSNSCSGLFEDAGPQWLEQPRGDLLGLEPNVALKEVDGCAICAEGPMRESKRKPSIDAQSRFLQGFGDRHRPFAMLDCLGATSRKDQSNADRAVHLSVAAGIIQGLGQRLGFESKLDPTGNFSERTKAGAYCQT